MMATGRLATPSMVHQLWDAICHGGSKGIDFEKLESVVKSMNEVPRDELIRELNWAIKDGLILTEAVETQNREDIEIYKLPDVSMMEKGDHDWYCFQCHLGGPLPVVKCKDCPRVYHLECLPEDRKPEKDFFVCPACHIKSTKPSAEKVIVKPEVLNQLLQYVCDRWSMTNANGETLENVVNPSTEEVWRFLLLVHMPINVQTMMSKAKQAKYTSLEEFQIDCETLIHAIAVYFGVEILKSGEIGKAFIRDVMREVNEIKLCHECFQHSNEKSHDWWFCLPCSTPHEVVWAKQKGFPCWPAKVMRKDGNKYDVRFFGGDYERGIIDAKNIKPIETSISQLKFRRSARWNDAFDELTKFQELAKDPELAQKLPPKGGKGAPSKGVNKRGATQSKKEVVTKKRRKNEAAATQSSPKPGASERAVPTPQANGTATIPANLAGRKKVGASTSSANESSPASAPAIPDSAPGPSSIPVTGSSTKPVEILVSLKEENQVHSDLSSGNLDPDVITCLNKVDESLEGEACFSGESSNELQENVTEDAVSSTCNEPRSTGNVDVHVSYQTLLEEKFYKEITDLQERHKLKISQTKKKQWCVICEGEAIYPCCWNTAYCSMKCQAAHWEGHRQQCGRLEPVTTLHMNMYACCGNNETVKTAKVIPQ